MVEAETLREIRHGRAKRPLRVLSLLSLLSALVVGLPLLSVAIDALQPASDVWSHVAGRLIPRYLMNTVWLCLGVGGLTGCIGVGAAWLITTYRFRGRQLLEWALILPLAIPSYVQAYIYYDLTNVSGPIQTGLRSWLDVRADQFTLPPLSSVPGAIFVLSIALYPYVYLAARTGFLQQTGTLVEISRMLGCTPTAAFFRVTLPLARPAIVVGLSLVLMETLADYGAVSLLGVQTFTTGIYKAWFSMGDRVAAAQLASILLLIVLVLVFTELSHRRGQFFNTGNDTPAVAQRLAGVSGAAALVACFLPAFLGFLLPAGYLLHMLAGVPDNPSIGFGDAVINTLAVAMATASIAVALGLFMTYGARLAPSRMITFLNRVAAMGYAVPGPVLAIGTLVPLVALDHAIDQLAQRFWGIQPGLLITGSIGALVFAYLARFMTVSLGAIEAGFAKVKPSLEDAAAVLGLGTLDRLRRVHLRLIGPSIATAGLLVFVDVMKELPATLILRPFDFDTLAVRVFNLARDERLAEAALPALILILVGLVPVIILSRQFSREKPDL
ncbi:MAG: iron ABC transporter permease [Geminicoccaceae bacterium]